MNQAQASFLKDLTYSMSFSLAKIQPFYQDIQDISYNHTKKANHQLNFIEIYVDDY